jgi:hypothetical protein
MTAPKTPIVRIARRIGLLGEPSSLVVPDDFDREHTSAARTGRRESRSAAALRRGNLGGDEMALRRTTLFVLPVLIAALSIAGPVRADGIADAEDLFRQGKELLSAGKAVDACPLLAESQRLDPQPGTLLNLASCHEATGGIAAAWGEYKVVEQQSLAARPPREDRALIARERAAKLAPRLSRLKLVVTPPRVSGMVVKVDGEVRGEPLWNVGIIVDVGTREVELSAPGKKTQTLKVKIAQEGTTTTATLPSLADGSDAGALASLDDASSGRRTTGYVVGAVGLAVAAAGGAFGVAAIANNDKARSCPAPCYVELPPGQESDRATDRALLFATVADVLIPLGALGVIVGGYFILSSSRAAIRPIASRDGAGLGVHGSW